MTYEIIFEILIIFIITIYFHEAGHYYILKNYGVKPEVKFLRIEYDYDALDDSKKKKVLLMGIIAGTIPIIIFRYIPTNAVLLLFIFYLLAIRKDIKRIKELGGLQIGKIKILK